ncbi:hypothetical protein [uncultured Chitinophaga sp.]|jgi:hypothetical protein|uniref:hypothetical protein n=1 Tax=uncultured Chitinophaga sp. TaxID=339340 RepID=UPI002610D581|nr:hypothetical protein [uncultured Chitinophaga sp.]
MEQADKETIWAWNKALNVILTLILLGGIIFTVFAVKQENAKQRAYKASYFEGVGLVESVQVHVKQGIFGDIKTYQLVIGGKAYDEAVNIKDLKKGQRISFYGHEGAIEGYSFELESLRKE